MKKVTKRLSAIALAIVMVVAAIGILPAPSVVKASNNPTVKYKVHRQTYGWEDEWKTNGESSGTIGEGKRLESIKIDVDGAGLGVLYRTHIQSYGWESAWRVDEQLSGTEGQAKRLEAIQIKLTGPEADKWDIYYRVHAQTYGWMGWVKNGESAGTAGQGKRLEAIQIVILPKGTHPSEGSMGCGFVDIAKKPSHTETGAVTYMTHVQSYGDQAWVSDGSIAGTSGEAKRLEQISIKMNNAKLDNVTGGVEYKTHVQSYGWMDWVKDGARSGTSGQGKRLEGIKIRLTGELANKYDIYYRVHAQSYGWLGWVKNGAPSGTEGYGKRLEAIQIVVVPKGTAAPNSLPAKSDQSGFVSKTGTCSDKDDTGITQASEYVPSEPGYIQDGYWYFRSYYNKATDEDFYEKGIMYAYNLSSKTLQKMDFRSCDDENVTKDFNPEKMCNSIYITETGLYNLMTGKYIFTLKDNQHWIYDRWTDGNTVLLYEETENFSGNTYSIGILDTNAKWVMPMSDKLSSNIKGMIEDTTTEMEVYYYGDNYYRIGTRYDSFRFNCATLEVCARVDDSNFGTSGNIGSTIFGTTYMKAAIFDLKTGEYKTLSEPNGTVNTWANGYSNGSCINDNCFWYKKDTKVYGVDTEGKYHAVYDISKYNRVSMLDITKNEIFFSCENNSGDTYVCLMKPDGTMVFDPVKSEGSIHGSAVKSIIDDNKLIVYGKSETDALLVYDIATKKQTVINTSQYTVESYDEDLNMFLVTKIVYKDGNKRYCRYLVNINDLNTLINPFE